MTVYTQTHQYTARDHVNVIEKAIGRTLDHVIVNDAPIPNPVKKAYALQHEYPVIDDLGESHHLIRRPLITQTKVQRHDSSDVLKRSFLRHNPQKLAKIIMSIC